MISRGFVVMVLWLLSVLGPAAERPLVLVIESYHADYQWDRGYTSAIREELGELAELVFFQMDTKRRPQREYSERAELAWQRYKALRPDLVILGDDNALKYLGPRLADTPTPVIYLGVNDNPRHYFDHLPANITGVLERPLLGRSIVHLRRILGGSLGRALVLFDDGTTARAALQEAFGGEPEQVLGSVEVSIRLIGTFDDWKATVASATEKGYDAIVVGLYHTLTDAEGKSVPEQEVIRWTSAHSRVPLFAFWSFAVGEGMTVGGLVLDAETQGRLAAGMAAQVLAGEPVSLMPTPSGHGVFLFSRAELARWGIQLPEAIAAEARFVP